MREKKVRKICILSGKRGGFGSLIRTMKMIDNDSELQLQLVVTDMHLSDKFGKTLEEVEKNFKVATCVDMKQRNGSSLARSEAMGECKKKISKVFYKLKPDLFLCLGDRGEVLVSVIAANNLRIPVAHIQGGDISGNLDEVFRHAITKMSHIHFPSTHESAKRIEKMGEESWRIHVVGDTHLDLIANKMYTANELARKKFGIQTAEKYIIILQHPVNTEPKNSYIQMKQTLEAARLSKMKSIVIYPCSDQGYDGVIKAIKEFKHNPNFLIHKNFDAQDFLGLLEKTEMLIGNSSSGIIETPLLKIPTINIGKRQQGRLRDYNVIDIDGNNYIEIFNAIKYVQLNKEYRQRLNSCGTIYGDGKTAERIVEIIKRININDKLFEKKMVY